MGPLPIVIPPKFFWNASVFPRISIDDGDGNENVTFKMNSRFFQILSRLFQFAENVKYGWISQELISWGPKLEFRKTKEIRCGLITSSIKHEIGHFHVVVMQGTGQKWTNKVWCTCRVVVLLLFDVLVAVAVVDAKAPFFLAPCVEVSWRRESTKTCRKCGSCE